MLARLGYLAIGLVYLIIGGLAARVASSSGSSGSAKGANVDRWTALDTIYQQSFGKVQRQTATSFPSAVRIRTSHTALVRPLCSSSASPSTTVPKRAGRSRLAPISWPTQISVAASLPSAVPMDARVSARLSARRLLDQPFGVWLVVLVALIVLGFAFEQFGRAYTASFEKHLDLSALRGSLRDAVVWLGRAGYAARGVVFAEIGVFLIVAARNHNTKDAKGLGGALTQLASEPYGHLLLAVVVLGFVAYGLFCLAQSRYRKIAQS